jgi:hypothetical protein
VAVEVVAAAEAEAAEEVVEAAVVPDKEKRRYKNELGQHLSRP